VRIGNAVDDGPQLGQHLFEISPGNRKKVPRIYFRLGDALHLVDGKLRAVLIDAEQAAYPDKVVALKRLDDACDVVPHILASTSPVRSPSNSDKYISPFLLLANFLGFHQKSSCHYLARLEFVDVGRFHRADEGSQSEESFAAKPPVFVNRQRQHPQEPLAADLAGHLLLGDGFGLELGRVAPSCGPCRGRRRCHEALADFQERLLAKPGEIGSNGRLEFGLGELLHDFALHFFQRRKARRVLFVKPEDQETVR